MSQARESSEGCPRVWVRKAWVGWYAIHPDEVLGTIESNTRYRSWTREGAIAKARKALAPRPSPWERV